MLININLHGHIILLNVYINFYCLVLLDNWYCWRELWIKIFHLIYYFSNALLYIVFNKLLTKTVQRMDIQLVQYKNYQKSHFFNKYYVNKLPKISAPRLTVILSNEWTPLPVYHSGYVTCECMKKASPRTTPSCIVVE